MSNHDLHEYLAQSQRWIQEEYEGIQKRATEDPGTAGDQGEENWAEILRRWLPPYFQIVTKGRILTESGYASHQIDVVVLLPSYPKGLLGKKLYLSGGVAAAFECKTTLKAEHVHDAIRTGAALRQHLPKREGSPYKDLNSTILYGLLAHSHCWRGEKSSPIENIEGALWASDKEFVKHPVECLDFLCVADLATWTLQKMNYMHPPLFKDPKMAQLFGGHASTAYMCFAIGQEMQKDYFSPLGSLLAGLYQKLAWTFHDMRSLDQYFRNVNMWGAGEGKSRYWDISIYSAKVQEQLLNVMLVNGGFFNEWSMAQL